MSFDFKKGFQIYHKSDKRRMFPDEWLYSKKYSNEKRMVFQAYDANLFPLPDIKTWNPNAIKETCEKVAELFKDCDNEIYLDGYLLDKTTKELSKEQLKD